MNDSFPAHGAVFWPVGTGDSTTIVVDDSIVVQVDLHDMAKADDDANPELPVVDLLAEALPLEDGKPYLSVFALTHADKDHCLGFADLLSKVTIGELWATPRLWREFLDPESPELCEDAKAFQAEAERRVAATKKAVADGTEPGSGDRILVVGYDSEHSKHAYDELPDKYLTGPGRSITTLDGRDVAGQFEAFIHAPFRDDAAAARNETSLSLQVTLTDESGVDGKLLLFGDLAHDTIMKIFDYSEYHNREQYLEWNLLLAPHHCSKKVMYKPDGAGKDELQMDVLNAFERHQREEAVIVSSSAPFPESDSAGDNPPHRKAADRYSEIADEVISTMTWLDINKPSPLVFGVSPEGAAIVRDSTVELTADAAIVKGELAVAGNRMGAIAAAATLLAESMAARPGRSATTATGPDRVQAAADADRGGTSAPDTPVGFGR
ncbi:hypothetical protein BH09ACT4_BH09ACT4_12520 [soil metagenome]